jgi:ATP-dependent DNA helicase RecG
MRRDEVLDLIRNGEDSVVEFKRDDVANHDLAKHLVGLLNFEGGRVLLGIEDDGSVSGTTRGNLEEWVAELCRVKVEPPIIPYMSWGRDIEPGKHVLVVGVPVGPDKPYARVHDAKRTYFVRVGRSTREASREELERMFQASGRLSYGLKPVPGARLSDLDPRRLSDYLVRVLGGTAPEAGDIPEWERLLTNLDLMTSAAGQAVPNVDAMLLFGSMPRRFLPQSGIRAIAYAGHEPDYAARADQIIGGALVPLAAEDGSILESGLVEQALDFVVRNTQPSSALVGGQRVDRSAFPQDVLRELVVNALVHRDYSIAGADVTLHLFENRLEIASPGRLPNTVTVDGMRTGLRYARNQTLVYIMRDYRYVEARGMGVRYKVIPGMRRHNETEPQFSAEDTRFVVTLWNTPKA